MRVLWLTKSDNASGSRRLITFAYRARRRPAVSATSSSSASLALRYSQAAAMQAGELMIQQPDQIIDHEANLRNLSQLTQEASAH